MSKKKGDGYGYKQGKFFPTDQKKYRGKIPCIYRSLF